MFDQNDTERKGYLSEKSAVKLVRQLNNRLLVSRIKNRVKVGWRWRRRARIARAAATG